MRIWISRATLALVFVSFTALLFVAARRNGWIGGSAPEPARLTAPNRATAPVDEASTREPGRLTITAPKRITEAAERTAAAGAVEAPPDTSPEGRLVTAAFDGDADAVGALLAEGVSPEARNRKGRGALHRAAEAGAMETLNLLLRAGADPDAPDGNGMTPLMAAAFGGSFAAGSRLLAAGAEVNAQHEPHRVTALEQVLGGWSAGAGGSSPDSPLDDDRRRFAEALFRAGADPNRASIHGPPIRYLPLFRTDEELVALFFENGARLDDLPHFWVFERLPGRVGEYVREAVREAKERAASP